MTFFDKHSGALSVFVNIILVAITAIYVFLTFKLSQASNKTIEYTSEEKEDKQKRENLIKNNLIHLICSELGMNSKFYVISQYYLTSGKNGINLLERMKSIFNSVSIEKDSKGFITKYIRDEIWKQLYSECVQYFPSELIQDLIGYYSGVDESRKFSIDGMSTDQFLEFCEGQLISTYKCYDLLKNETDNLRVIEEHEIEGYLFKVDSETGKLFGVV